MGGGLRAAVLDTTSVAAAAPVAPVVAVACSKSGRSPRRNIMFPVYFVIFLYKKGNERFSTHMAPFDKPTASPGKEFGPDSREIGPEG